MIMTVDTWDAWDAEYLKDVTLLCKGGKVWEQQESRDGTDHVYLVS